MKKVKYSKISGGLIIEDISFKDGVSSKSVTEYDFTYIHYTEEKKGYKLWIPPYREVVQAFWEDYKIEPKFIPELKVYMAEVRKLPKDKQLTFVPFQNKPISPIDRRKATQLREDLGALDETMEDIKFQHAKKKKQFIDLVGAKGILSLVGRVYHRKMFALSKVVGNWVAELRQLLPSGLGVLTLPSVKEIEDLMEAYPKHRKQLRKMIQRDLVCTYRFDNISEGDLVKIVKKLKRYNITDIALSFEAKKDDFDEEDFEKFDLLPGEDDIDTEVLEAQVEKLSFDLKLELLDLPSVEDAKMQFHYKTPKTEPECLDCGGEFIKNTYRCKVCGGIGLREVKSDARSKAKKKKVKKKPGLKRKVKAKRKTKTKGRK